MAKNKNLAAAKVAKEDEFYTQFVDIENELVHYTSHFKDSVVFCNCDDPYESNFFKYFALNFNRLGLRRLICTCYDNSPIAYNANSLFHNVFPNRNGAKNAYLMILDYVDDANGDGAIDLRDVEIILHQNPPRILEGNGDFRSPECIELLKQADIIVTNPPFSLFREYIAQLITYNKKFLIIGNQSSISCKDIFPLILEKKMWVGVNSGKMEFLIPTIYDNKKTNIKQTNGQIVSKMGNICWYTNLDHKKRHEELTLYKYYCPEEYPKYDNFDAINVNLYSDIPMDYNGIMGVPITFLNKFNPEQFEILGLSQIGCHDLVPDTKKYGEYKEMRRDTNQPTGASGNKTNENAVLIGKGNKSTYFINADGRIVYSVYKRLFIRKI